MTFEFEGVKVSKTVGKNNRIVRIEKPIERNLIGRYCVGVHEEQEEKFSDSVKDWIVAEGRVEGDGWRDLLTVT